MRFTIKRSRAAAAAGHYEAGLIASVYRACGKCGLAHPRATGARTDICACGNDCGHPDQFDADKTAITAGGFWPVVAKTLLGIGQFLYRLVKRM